MSSNTMDEVERLTRRRARIATAMGILFITTQGARIAESHLTRPVDYVQFTAWLLWTVMLLAFLFFGGAFWRSAAMRKMLNDEGTEANRREALVFGFWMLLIGAALCYAMSFFDPGFTVREAIHIIITFGVGITLLRFGALERRALKA